MSAAQQISAHCISGDNLLARIEADLARLGKTSASMTIDDLGLIDACYIGGRPATSHFMNQLGFTADHQILDVGCGLGGAARFAAATFKCRVTGVEATEEYVNVGQKLCRWVGLDEQVSLHHGSTHALPFADGSFDGAYMIHVGMNLRDKTAVFREVYRLLQPGMVFGIYDVMAIDEGEFAYPVPWADKPSLSYLSSPAAYKIALETAGFKLLTVNSRRNAALAFFSRLRDRLAKRDLPSPVELRLLRKEDASLKLKNMVRNLETGLIVPVEMIAKRP